MSSRFPSEEEVSALLEKCGMGRLPEALPVEDGLVDPASLGFPQFNYNAIAQGYSCDVVARFLYRIGVYSFASSITLSMAADSPSTFLPPAWAKWGCPPPPPWISFAASRTICPAFSPCSLTMSSLIIMES